MGTLWVQGHGNLFRARHHAQLQISFGGISLLFMEDYAPSTFLGNWALVVLYLCFSFHIFNRFISKSMFFKLKGGPHIFQSCFHIVWDNLFFITRKMHLSFESLVVIDALGLQAFLMDIHHDTSFGSILEDDFISSTSRAHIYFRSNKG